MGSSESSLPPTGPELIQSRDRDISMFLPFLLTLDESNPDPDHPDNSENPSPNSNTENPNPPSDESDPPRRQSRRGDRIILINPLTQGMVVIEGANLRSMLGNNIPTKTEQRPASKASIDAMPTVEVTEKEEGECPICLDEWKAAEEEQDRGGGDGGGVVAVVKQMPCKHRFHGECIEKWLRIHGSCPVCRFMMPSEDEDDVKKSDDGEAEDDGDDDDTERRTRRRWGGESGIWVSFRFGNRRRDSDRDDDSDSDSD